MLIDSHCHLDFPDFHGERDAVIDRARAAGIKGMLTICTRLGDAAKIRSIADTHEGIWCSQGVHPHEAEHAAEVTAEDLIALTGEDKVVGIGETGLDFYYEHSPRDIQERVFRAHIEAARETGLPLIVHTRDADEETVRILGEEQARGRFPGVIHCFSAGPEVARCALEHGMYISFSGIVTFKNAQSVRDVAAEVPLERLLVETDAPYLAPVPMRGKRNEPAFTAHTAAYVAKLRGLALEEFERITTDNFFALFARAERAGLPS
ncbi:MAG: TatD family hydrolase [Alphaproteobacteria bacterium]|nr:TatD family hydrolase [Alphaproteobacteria bacterium]